MGEPAEVNGLPSRQTTCLDCGVEVGRFSFGAECRFVACSALVLT